MIDAATQELIDTAEAIHESRECGVSKENPEVWACADDIDGCALSAMEYLRWLGRDTSRWDIKRTKGL